MREPEAMHREFSEKMSELFQQREGECLAHLRKVVAGQDEDLKIEFVPESKTSGRIRFVSRRGKGDE